MSDAITHLRWGAEALWEELVPVLPGLTIEVVGRADSTNTRLIERAREAGGNRDAPITRPGQIDAASRNERTPHGRRAADMAPCLLVAEQQTRGRGRLGRGWHSAPLASLTFSLALPLAPRDWSGLSLAVGLALAQALDPLPADDAAASPRLQLKWPNDLWLAEGPCAGRKLGGILIETVTVGRHRMCVIGVGLNVLPLQLEGLASGYACLQELDARASAPAALKTVALPLVQALVRFEHEGFAPLVDAYERRDLLRGCRVRTGAEAAADGVVEGVDPSGALRLRVDGDVQRVVSGEVHVTPIGLDPVPDAAVDATDDRR